MKLTDTHCHLYLDEFKNDIDEVIRRAEEAGVTKFYLPAIDSKEMEKLLWLEKSFPGKCFAMTGLHPCSVKEGYKAELELVSGLLSHRKFAAIGEIGLDLYWDKTFIKEQYDAFRVQAIWALQYELPVVIHTRNAMQETIDLVKEFVPRGIRGIFHCFSGNYENALEIINAGFYIGIGGVITYKNSGLAEVVARIGLEHIVLETDAPFLAPVPFRSKRNESSNLKYIVEKLADVKQVSADEVAAITTANAEKIFRL